MRWRLEWAFASRFERIPDVRDNEHHELHEQSCTFPSGVYTPSSRYLDWIKDVIWLKECE